MENLKEKVEALKNDEILSPEQESAFIDSWIKFDKNIVPDIIREELAELSAAICKHVARPKEGTFFNLEEELADVEIVTEYCKRYFNIDQHRLDKFKTVKLTQPKPGTDTKDTETTQNAELYDILSSISNVTSQLRSAVTLTESTLVVDKNRRFPAYTHVRWVTMDLGSRRDYIVDLRKAVEYLLDRILHYHADDAANVLLLNALQQIFSIIRYSNIDPVLWSAEYHPIAIPSTVESYLEVLLMWCKAVSMNYHLNRLCGDTPYNFYTHRDDRVVILGVGPDGGYELVTAPSIVRAIANFAHLLEIESDDISQRCNYAIWVLQNIDTIWKEVMKLAVTVTSENKLYYNHLKRIVYSMCLRLNPSSKKCINNESEYAAMVECLAYSIEPRCHDYLRSVGLE